VAHGNRAGASTKEELPTLELYEDLLRGRAAIAEYYFGEVTPTTLRRITALLNEVPKVARLPHYREGGGLPVSRKSWLDDYTKRRAKYLPAA
jgi:hypothetical protein